MCVKATFKSLFTISVENSFDGGRDGWPRFESGAQASLPGVNAWIEARVRRETSEQKEKAVILVML